MKKKTKKVLAATVVVGAALAYQRSRDTYAKTRRGSTLVEDPLDSPQWIHHPDNRGYVPQTNGYITIRPENFNPKRKHAAYTTRVDRPAKRLQPTRLPTPRDEFQWFDNYS